MRSGQWAAECSAQVSLFKTAGKEIPNSQRISGHWMIDHKWDMCIIPYSDQGTHQKKGEEEFQNEKFE